jgi:hypothetical protein
MSPFNPSKEEQQYISEKEDASFLVEDASMFGGSDALVTNRDCWNHLRYLRLKNLDLGDAE